MTAIINSDLRCLLQGFHMTQEQLLERRELAKKIPWDQVSKGVRLNTCSTHNNQWYLKRDRVHPTHGISGHLQLNFLFSQDNDFAAADSKVCKHNIDENVAQAIWFCKIYKKHSFSRRHELVRLNFLLTLITKASDMPLVYTSCQVDPFINNFILGWIDSVTWPERNAY